jgi:hypothetical protein
MELHLQIIGILLIILSVAHFRFPKYFNWKQELHSLSLINRQMMYVHLLFIAIMLFLVGLLCLSSSKELLGTTLGRRISFGVGLFWIARLYVQFFGYSSKIWVGKSFETIVHVGFALFWGYLSTVFILIYFA